MYWVRYDNKLIDKWEGWGGKRPFYMRHSNPIYYVDVTTINERIDGKDFPDARVDWEDSDSNTGVVLVFYGIKRALHVGFSLVVKSMWAIVKSTAISIFMFFFMRKHKSRNEKEFVRSSYVKWMKGPPE